MHNGGGPAAPMCRIAGRLFYPFILAVIARKSCGYTVYFGYKNTVIIKKMFPLGGDFKGYKRLFRPGVAKLNFSRPVVYGLDSLKVGVFIRADIYRVLHIVVLRIYSSKKASRCLFFCACIKTAIIAINYLAFKKVS